jgi:hypothetical protein
MSEELVRMTNRFSPEDIRILDRIKDAGSYTSRNAVILALIRKCGTQYANRLESAFNEVTFDTTSVTNDATSTPNSTYLTPTNSTNLTSHDTTSVTNDATSTPLDWNTLISEA